MKMTTPWLDYLLCQLSAEKPLSTLETLPAELLDPILEEVCPCHKESLKSTHFDSFIQTPSSVYGPLQVHLVLVVP